jgi:hypothetical protein
MSQSPSRIEPGFGVRRLQPNASAAASKQRHQRTRGVRQAVDGLGRGVVAAAHLDRVDPQGVGQLVDR